MSLIMGNLSTWSLNSGLFQSPVFANSNVTHQSFGPYVIYTLKLHIDECRK